MRQRAVIAMAVANDPNPSIADEPTTALDVTVQAQILLVPRSLQERLGLGLILITHDLGVVAGYADRVAVVYSGRIVEQASVSDLFADPRHPYTSSLRRFPISGDSRPAVLDRGFATSAWSVAGRLRVPSSLHLFRGALS